MDEEKLVEYLMEGVVILKNVRDANLKVNAQIDDFLKRLSEAATKKEETSKEPKKAGEPQKQEAGDEMMKKMMDMMQKIQEYDRTKEKLGGSSPLLVPGNTTTMSEKMKEAMKEAQEAAILKKTPMPILGGGTLGATSTVPEVVSTPSPSMAEASLSPSPTTYSSAAQAGVGIEQSDAPPIAGGTAPAKGSKVIKLSKGKVTGSSTPSEGLSELPTVDDSAFTAGKVWCAVCEEYHSPEDEKA